MPLHHNDKLNDELGLHPDKHNSDGGYQCHHDYC
jgi:hypothetical protein